MENINVSKKHTSIGIEKCKNVSGDCRLIIFSTLLKYYGVKNILPRELIGFGKGLDFDYKEVQLKSLKLISVNGRKEDFILKLCKKNNLDLKKCKSNMGYSHIITNLNNNVPVIICLDRYYLEYLKIERAHFGYHVVLVIDYNDKGIRVIDALSDKIEVIDYATLERAIYSNLKYLSPNGAWFVFNDNKNKLVNYNNLDNNNIMTNNNLYNHFEIKNDRFTFFMSVKEQSEIMLKQNGSIDKLIEVTTFIKKLYKKIKTMPSYVHYLKYQIPFICTSIKEQDGESSFYRRLYYDFLKDYLRYYNFNIFYSSIKNIIDKELAIWNYVGYNLCKENKNISKQTREIIICFKKIADLEKLLFSKLLYWAEEEIRRG